MYRIRYTLKMKKVVWHPKAIKEVRDFPVEARKELGYLIFRLQMGDLLTMPHSRSFSEVASGVSELRIKDAQGIYRVFYLLKSEKGIFIIHAFKKKTQATPQHEIEAAKKHLKEITS